MKHYNYSGRSSESILKELTAYLVNRQKKTRSNLEGEAGIEAHKNLDNYEIKLPRPIPLKFGRSMDTKNGVSDIFLLFEPFLRSSCVFLFVASKKGGSFIGCETVELSSPWENSKTNLQQRTVPTEFSVNSIIEFLNDALHGWVSAPVYFQLNCYQLP